MAPAEKLPGALSGWRPAAEFIISAACSPPNDVRLISPEYVRPYIKTRRDAEGIAEAVKRSVKDAGGADEPRVTQNP